MAILTDGFTERGYTLVNLTRYLQIATWNLINSPTWPSDYEHQQLTRPLKPLERTTCLDVEDVHMTVDKTLTSDIQ